MGSFDMGTAGAAAYCLQGQPFFFVFFEFREIGERLV
jgi:hypothetical protein